jgi:activator of HSP90 ATPase
MVKYYRMFAVAIALAALGKAYGWTPPQTITENPKTGAQLKSISIHHEVDFTASPKRLYEALLDSKQFSAFSARPAEINREVGGAFSLFGGHIVGRNLELVANQRIVQAWRVVDWQAGVFSIAHFELVDQGGSTKLVFDHTGFPSGEGAHLAEGWRVNYWQPLAKVLA